MKILGIIAEYNPFHTGHARQLEIALRETGADAVIAVMSGNFVQRGEPAVFDKTVRTNLALLGGADAVFEMPAPFSCAAAGDFALYGVSLLDALGADILCFGSECGDLALLEPAAEILADEPEPYRESLRASLKEGNTWPVARENALAGLLPYSPEKTAEILGAPNNILGLEYLAALRKLGSRMTPFTHRREGSGYHADTLPEEASFASATALRKHLLSGNLKDALFFLPPGSESVIRPEPRISADDFSQLLSYRILEKHIPPAFIDGFDDALSERLLGAEPDYLSFSERVSALRTRNYTESRVRRALIRLLLNIRKDDMASWKEILPAYARILGFRRGSSHVLSEIKNRAAVPLVTKTADAKFLLSGPALALFEKEVEAGHIYQTVRAQKGYAFRNAYREGPVII